MNGSLPVVETFHSLQGEGVHTGRSAFFIRLAGCKVSCSWCDTKHSWQADSHPKQNVNDLADEAASAKEAGAAFVVITGGEPLHHNLDPLTEAIRNTCRLPIHIETSGVDEMSGTPDWITLSPKRHNPPRGEILNACDELKIVIHNEEDLFFAEKTATQALRAILLLQPGWGSEQGQRLAIRYTQSHPQWRLSMQSHKWLKVR